MHTKISRAFRDISLSFTRHPVTNDITILKNEDAIKKSVINLCRTSINERFFNPLIGTRIGQSLFEVNDPDIAEFLEEDIENTLINYEPRIKVESVDAEWRGKVHKRLISFAKRDSPIHCEIVDIRRPTKTIICTYSHQPRLFVPLRNKNGQFLRMLLPDELKQIQSFPADYKMSGSTSKQIIQIGNAVPPLLIQKIVENI